MISDIYNHTSFRLENPIPIQCFDSKDAIMYHILREIRVNNRSSSLADIRINGSYEGGFHLPMNDEWNDWIRKSYNQSIYSRDLRFIDTDMPGYVTGIRCRYDIPYWTNAEVADLKELLEEYSRKRAIRI